MLYKENNVERKTYPGNILADGHGAAPAVAVGGCHRRVPGQETESAVSSRVRAAAAPCTSR